MRADHHTDHWPLADIVFTSKYALVSCTFMFYSSSQTNDVDDQAKWKSLDVQTDKPKKYSADLLLLDLFVCFKPLVINVLEGECVI